MTSRGLKIALAISLALNVFAVGAVVGAGYMRHRLVEPPRGERGPPLMRVGERLPEAKRAAFRARMRQEGMTARPLMREAREARREAIALFGQPQFDAAAASAALARARQAEFTARGRFETAMTEFATTLTPQERAELAKSIRSDGRGRGGGDGRRGPGGDGRRGPPPLER